MSHQVILGDTLDDTLRVTRIDINKVTIRN